MFTRFVGLSYFGLRDRAWQNKSASSLVFAILTSSAYRTCLTAQEQLMICCLGRQWICHCLMPLDCFWGGVSEQSSNPKLPGIIPPREALIRTSIANPSLLTSQITFPLWFALAHWPYDRACD